MLPPARSMSLRRKRPVLSAALLGLVLATSAQAAFWHKPPDVPLNGYGSPASYLTTEVQESTLGDGTVGSKVWVYEPAVLKDGDKAPVVVFLHGFAALKPYLYRNHLMHLAQQGNIVIFPQFQIGEGSGVLAEAGFGGEVDQTVWAQRAIDATRAALEALGERADTSRLYIYGHSLGGLIATAWEAFGGPAPQHYVLAHPAFDSTAGIPAFVRDQLEIKTIDWQQTAPQMTAPVTVLQGEEDTIAPPSQSLALADLLQAQGLPHSMYLAERDGYGFPALSPNHGGPFDSLPPWPEHVKIFGFSFELDGLDWRYYFAGLDAVMAGSGIDVPFDFGTWSNGRAAKAPQQVRRLGPLENTLNANGQ